MLLVSFGISMANKGKVQTAATLGQIALAISEKIFDKEISVATRAYAHGCITPLLQSFRSCIDPLLQTHKDLKLIGGMLIATLGSMLGYFECYFAAGLELGETTKMLCILSHPNMKKVSSHNE